MRILIEGWSKIPHSYAIVNCFQMIYLKQHPAIKEIYIKEMKYYQEKWNDIKKEIFPKEYIEILNSIPEWDNQEVDLIYRITYPYNINETPDNIPKCVFYTSEFSHLTTDFFQLDNKTNEMACVSSHLEKHKNIYMTSPSDWSYWGMKGHIEDYRNRIITHGVDGKIFKKNKMKSNIRNLYKIQDDEFVMVNIGGMTGNKGIVYIIIVLYNMVISGYKVKLLLKGSGDLYNSKEFILNSIDKIKQSSGVDNKKLEEVIAQNVIFIDQIMTFENINNLYNACDLYISPYIAEGFNMTVLEALSAELPILVPTTGSTEFFIKDIYRNGGDQFIYYTKSIVEHHYSLKQNKIDINDLYNNVILAYNQKNKERNGSRMINYIEKNYSWKFVADKLIEYFTFILSIV